MQIRLFQPKDAQAIAQLFHDTVRKVNIQDYSLAQVEAWSPEDIWFRNWDSISASRLVYVAEAEAKIIGFGELKHDGHIDCFYCHYQYQRQGVGGKIYRAIENKAGELNLTRLYTEASITAQPFFARQGFVTIKQQIVACRGEHFINYLMQKQI